jgi:hypothetical protein
MSTRNVLGQKVRLGHMADNLTTICEPSVQRCAILDI